LDNYGSAEGPWSVHALPLAGQAAAFAEGGDVDSGSLAVGSAVTYWTRGGEPHSAPIP
jgi:hypothetical protein